MDFFKIEETQQPKSSGNKRARDNQLAHEDRERDKVRLQKVLAGSGLHITKPGDGTIYTSMPMRKFLNSLSKRFPKTHSNFVDIMGHSLLLWDDRNTENFRYVEIRYPDRGWYWKAPVSDESGFNILLAINPLWLSIHPGPADTFYTAIISLTNPYMHRRFWQKSTSIGNKNRWVNNQASRMLKSTMGYYLPKQREDFVTDCYQFIGGIK